MSDDLPDSPAADPASASASASDPTLPRRRSLRRNTAVMAAGTFVSRALGLVRTMLLISAVGVTGSIAADAYSVANRLPNMMYAVLAAGVLNSALVPQIVKAFHEQRERTVHRILTLGGVGILVTTAVFTLLAGFWVRLFTDAWGPDQTALATAFAFWCIPQLLFYGLYTLFGQVLNAREQFGPFMWAPVANNVVSIAGLAVYLWMFGGFTPSSASAATIVGGWTPLKILLIAGVATLGIAVQALVLIPPMIRGGYRWKWVWRGPKGELSVIAKVASWALGAVLVEQVGVLLVTRIASAAPLVAAHLASPTAAWETLKPLDGVAGNAAYELALMLYLLPHSLISISLMTALFPRMSRFAADADLAGVRRTLSEGVRLVSVFTMIAAAVLFVAAPHVVRVMAPTTDAASLESVPWVLRLMVLGLVPLAGSVMAKQAFFALEDGRTVFVIHIAMTASLLAVAYAAQWWASPQWWVAGIALGMGVTNTVALVLRMVALRPKLSGVDGRRIGVTMSKGFAAALFAAVPGAAVMWLLPDTFARDGWGAVLGSAGIAVTVGLVMLVAYVVAVRVLRMSEATDAVRSLGRRIGRVR